MGCGWVRLSARTQGDRQIRYGGTREGKKIYMLGTDGQRKFSDVSMWLYVMQTQAGGGHVYRSERHGKHKNDIV